jgi:putative exosortase-associated protein (TIGR04073 family)
MSRISRSIAIALTVATLAGGAEAQDAARKFGRGLAGMTLAFLEVPGNMVYETHKRGAAGGIPLGFVIGLGMIVPRTLVGVYEFLTAPFPLPAGYQPILRPEFPWGYFEGEGRSACIAPGARDMLIVQRPRGGLAPSAASTRLLPIPHRSG